MPPLFSTGTTSMRGSSSTVIVVFTVSPLRRTNFSGTLPNMPVDTIVYQTSANHAVYIGTDAGVYYRNDALSDWVPYKYGLPNVIVDDLQIDYATKTVRAATYGRGLWQAPLY